MPRTSEDLDALLATVVVADGIQRQEARILTEGYFVTFLSGCGFAEGPTLRQGVWRSKARVGYSGDLLPGAIQVDARTGAINYPGCPAFRTVDEFRSAVRGVRSAVREIGRGEQQRAPELPCWMKGRSAG